MQKLIFQLIISSFLFFACGPSQKTQKENIFRMQKELENNFDTTAVAKLIDMYDTYIVKYPEDSLIPEFIFRVAEANRALMRGTQALINYDLLIKQYPNSEYVPECYFLKGLVFEDVLYDFNAANLSYREFIDKYPEHHLKNDAELSLNYLGMSIEQIIETFSDTLTVDAIR